MIIDAQTHAPYPSWLLSEHEEIVADVSVELLVAAMDAVGVDGALMHMRSDVSKRAFERYPDRFRSVALFDPRPNYSRTCVPASTPAEFEAIVDEMLETSGLVGLRMLIGNLDDGPEQIIDPADVTPVFELARRHGLPICLLALGRLEVIDAVARAYDDLTIVVDHLGQLTVTFADRTGLQAAGQVSELLAMAELPNVVVKMSGIPRLSREAAPFADVWPIVAKVIDAFGPDRVMWGSDQTVDPEHTYAESLACIRDRPEIDAADKERILGATAQRVFAWGSPWLLSRDLETVDWTTS